MKKFVLALVLSTLSCSAGEQQMTIPPAGHPDVGAWDNLFSADLSNAVFPEGIWTSEDGILTASEDQVIWTNREYDNFVLDLEFKIDEGANSGVVVYCTNTENWIPNSVEIQILDDEAEEWSEVPDNWHGGGIFGHLAPQKILTRKPGEWNRQTVTCVDSMIYVLLNGELASSINLNLWTRADKNPDGSEIPSWLSRPLAELPTHGYIGLQGKHAGASIFFRNIKIKELK